MRIGPFNWLSTGWNGSVGLWPPPTPSAPLKPRLASQHSLVASREESITITKHGRPVARLVPVNDVRVSRDWGDFWARVDERREALSAGGVGFTQEQIKDEITQGRV